MGDRAGWDTHLVPEFERGRPGTWKVAVRLR
jgi:hypothetical protein